MPHSEQAYGALKDEVKDSKIHHDNAHVEQKNWTHVRHLLGYDRLEDPEMLPLINTIYREIWEPYNNFFIPCMKLI